VPGGVLATVQRLLEAGGVLLSSFAEVGKAVSLAIVGAFPDFIAVIQVDVSATYHTPCYKATALLIVHAAPRDLLLV